MCKNNSKVISYGDLEEVEISGHINTIKEKNPIMYNAIYNVLQSNGAASIREDVLKYFSMNAEKLPQEQEYAFHMAFLLENKRLSPEWYEWINDSFISKGTVPLADIMVALNAIIEKDMALEDAKKLFNENDNDVLLILQTVVDYETNESLGVGDEGIINKSSAVPVVSETSKNALIPESLEGDLQRTSSLDDILNVMNIKGRGAICSVLDVQDGFNKILAKYQLAFTELSSYSTEVIREWEKDKDEIERFNSLYAIYQKMIGRQQKKINEQENEIARLKSVIQDAEKKALKREAIIKKITELQLSAQGLHGM